MTKPSDMTQQKIQIFKNNDLANFDFIKNDYKPIFATTNSTLTTD